MDKYNFIILDDEEKVRQFIKALAQVEEAPAKPGSEDPDQMLLEDQELKKAAGDLVRLTTVMLQKIGIPQRLIGFFYIRDALCMTVRQPRILSSLTKQLYPQIALNHHTTPARVERGIRSAIDITFKRYKTPYAMSVFESILTDVHFRPTNSEFIAILSDKLRMLNS